MNRWIAGIPALVLVGGILMSADREAIAQQPTTPAATTPAAAPATPRPRIGLVNIAKVLKDFKKANAEGEGITMKRMEYVKQVNAIREMMQQKHKMMQTTPDNKEKERLQNEAIELQHSIEKIDREAAKVLGEMSDKTIVEVYQQVKATINDIAVTHNFDLILCYPAASTPEDEKKPAVAQLMLQTPAMMPYYSRGMDITDAVVQTLNIRHPSAAKAIVPVNGTTTGQK